MLGTYFTGDGALRDADGYYVITGRMDYVINFTGHRLGSAEIEDVLVSREHIVKPHVRSRCMWYKSHHIVHFKPITYVLSLWFYILSPSLDIFSGYIGYNFKHVI